MRRPLVYVSGPRDRAANLRRLRDLGLALVEAGFAPFVPVGYERGDRILGDDDPSYGEVLEADCAFLSLCDALISLPGPSRGATFEIEHAKQWGIPTARSLGELTQSDLCSAPHGDLRFHRLLREIERLHDRKQKDYGTPADPFANVRASREWGIPSWVGAVLRITDKIRRLQRFHERGNLANEGVEDSLKDIAVYAMIALILYRETTPATDAL